MLEDHRGVTTVERDLLLFELTQLAVPALVSDELASNEDLARVDALEVVDGAQEGRLART
jgi:hypothetical protein